MYMYIGEILRKLCKPSTFSRNLPEVHASACVVWSFPHLPINLLVWLVYSYELRLLTN